MKSISPHAGLRVTLTQERVGLPQQADSSLRQHKPSWGEGTFSSCPCTSDFIEDGFSEDTPLTATFTANVLSQDGQCITLEREIVFLCEYSECDWSEVGQLDLDGEEGGR